MAAASGSFSSPTTQRAQHHSTSSASSPAANLSATTELHPPLPSHRAIQHLRQLHPQLDNEQLLAIAHEALHPPAPPPNPPISSSSDTFPPLSVVACPGSGKTLTLAARIAFFISYHRIPAHHILAITFTRKAKAELVDRVNTILQHERTAALADGRHPASSDKLRVCTFSSLAFRYVQQYAHKFGWQSSMSVLKDDNATRRILRDIVEQTQAAARQKAKAREAADYEIKQDMGRDTEGEEQQGGSLWDDQLDEEEMVRVTDEAELQQCINPPPFESKAAPPPPPPAAVPSLASAWATRPLGTHKELNKFVSWAFEHIERVRLRAGLTLKPATASTSAHLHTLQHYSPCGGQQLSEDDDVLIHELLRAYDAKLHAGAQLGKGDLIPALLALLRADESVLRAVRSEWRAVFVDEVQDSSRADIALLLALVGCERWKEVEKSGQGTQLRPMTARLAAQQRGLTSHLCLVGDPQQSIYGFRGADPLALDTVSAVLDQHGLVRLRLSSNYRSTQHIVNTAVAIIASNGARREERKRKRDEEENDDEGSKQAQQQPTKQPALTPTPTHASSSTLPTSSRTVTAHVNPTLRRLHTTPLPSTARQAVHRSTGPAPPPSSSMRTRNELGERVIELRTDGWRQEMRCIADHIRALTSRRGWSTQRSYRYTDIAILVRTNTVGDRVKRELRLARLPVAKVYPEDKFDKRDDDGGGKHKDDGVEDGVHVLTVHKAKGLEWPVVFVAAFSEGNMPLSASPAAGNVNGLVRVLGGESVGLASAADVDDDGVNREDAGDVHDREECRVAYVAVTRARQLLFLCHSREDDCCGRLSPSRYLSYIPAELRRVQDECTKVPEVVGGGARTPALTVFFDAMGPSATASCSAASKGHRRHVRGQPPPASRSRTAGVKRETAVRSGGGSRTIASGWTTAAVMQTASSSMAVDVSDDGMGVDFQRGSALLLKECVLGGQVKEE